MSTQQLDIDVAAELDNLAQTLQPLASADPKLIMVGIHTGGAWLAQRLHAQLKLKTALCTLNISFYRDDFASRGLHPHVGPSEMPEDIDGRHLLLVDDILYTGRTIRAAMNELFDYGRPASIRLVTLVNRGGHELPISPDYQALQIRDVPDNRQIKMTGPTDLKLVLK